MQSWKKAGGRNSHIVPELSHFVTNCGINQNSKGELILIEVQNNNEYAYFQRMLFGTSKLVAECINCGEEYGKVRKHLKLDRMTKDELAAYYRHLDNIVILRDNIYTEWAEGRAEGIEEGIEKDSAAGIAEGIEKGRAEERFSNARKMKAKGVDSAIISDITGLPQEEIEKL